MKTRFRVHVVLSIAVIIIGISPAVLANDANFAHANDSRQGELVTYHQTGYYALPTKSDLDPHRDRLSFFGSDFRENLFLGLTNNDPTAGITPELATSWTVGENGTVWTFKLRDDVSWIRWNPATGEGERIRPVTARDAAFGIIRRCDPRMESYYTYVAAQLIAGCDTLAAMPSDQIADTDYAQVQAYALDDTTLEVILKFPAGYFLTLTSTWMFQPVPRENIEEYGDSWIEPGTIVTNGPYVLQEWTPDARQVFLRNPYLPGDLRGPGNVDQVIYSWAESLESALVMYDSHQTDSVPISAENVPFVTKNEQYAADLLPTFNLLVYFFGLAHDKAPFDNVHVRRAFSAAIDRQQLFEAVAGQAYPMIHLTPPGIIGAPAINEAGVGHNPEYAREQLAQAGYPDCEGLPEISALTFPGGGAWFEFMATSIRDALGCDPALLQIEEVDWATLIRLIDPTLFPEERPHMWPVLFGPDFPDPHNYLGDILSCESANSFNRVCSEVDDLINQAAAEPDPVRRAALYHDIENRFFGPDGEAPIIPLGMLVDYRLQKTWVTYASTLGHSGIHFDWITIDQAAQLAARGQ